MKATFEEIILQGRPICRGIGIGVPFFLTRNQFQIIETDIPFSQTDQEIDRYKKALLKSCQEIKRLKTQLERESAQEAIAVLDAQLEILQDPLLNLEMENRIRNSHKNAEFIFRETIDQLKLRFADLNNAFFEERFKDIQELAYRILSYLYDSVNLSMEQLTERSIICCEELTALDSAEADSSKVSAFITQAGGSTSHAAIVAKSKGIPYVTHIDISRLKESQNQTLIVDGRTGKVILNPKTETLRFYQLLQSQICNQIDDSEKSSMLPAETIDGFSIRLSANLESVQEIELLNRFGGEGIGLFRSEYIFLPKNEIPSEEEQFQIYRHIVETMDQKPVVIRTFDLGGDKISSHYAFMFEKTPFLSPRTTRLLLKERDLFKAQLRAILRTSPYGNVAILFPMIATLSELREAKGLVKEVQSDLALETSVPIGCMIEVPSAAMVVDHLVRECDFLSIGTNDLVQYSLVVDRNNQHEHEFYEPSDPSILRLIYTITSAARSGRVPVTICGEMASDPRYTALLMGLGIQGFSVPPRYLPIIKNAVRSTTIVQAVHLAEQAMNCLTSDEVLNLVSADYKTSVPEDLIYH